MPMLSRLIKRFFLKVYVSTLVVRLESLNDRNANNRRRSQVSGIKEFFSDLINIRTSQHDRFVSNLFTSHTPLLLKIENAVESGDVNGFRDLSPDIKIFLDQVFDAASYVSHEKKRKKTLIVTASVLVVLLAFFYSPLKKRYYRETEEYNLIANEEVYKQQTMTNMISLKKAIDEYFHDNHSYPESSGGWDATVASYGESRKDWIRGLVPKYLKALPSDPRESQDEMKQFMYKSDGNDFKLLAHFPLGVEEVIKGHPELVDPRRPTWAYGFWSEGAKDW